MATDENNLKLQIVKADDEDRFKEFTPDQGELHFRMKKRFASVGDGSKKGGYALASRDFVVYAIAVAEANGTTAGIPVD